MQPKTFSGGRHQSASRNADSLAHSTPWHRKRLGPLRRRETERSHCRLRDLALQAAGIGNHNEEEYHLLPARRRRANQIVVDSACPSNWAELPHWSLDGKRRYKKTGQPTRLSRASLLSLMTRSSTKRHATIAACCFENVAVVRPGCLQALLAVAAAPEILRHQALGYTLSDKAVQIILRRLLSVQIPGMVLPGHVGFADLQ